MKLLLKKRANKRAHSFAKMASKKLQKKPYTILGKGQVILHQ